MEETRADLLREVAEQAVERIDSAKGDFRFVLENQSHTTQRLLKALTISVVAGVLGVLLTIAGFLWYLNQYDFTSTETSSIEASGIYTLVGDDGNIIAQDVAPETWESFLKWIEVNGESAEDDNKDKEKNQENGQ